jgi:hypothetical protein
MPYTSPTRSWKVCNKDQQREVKAHAVFTKLQSLPSDAKSFVFTVKFRLQNKIDSIKEKAGHIEDDELQLLAKEHVVKALSEDAIGISKIESNFALFRKFEIPTKIGDLSSGLSISILEGGDLSKLLKAKNKFKYTGGVKGAPNGKSESIVGISDSLLDKLVDALNASSLITSWMEYGDTIWKKWVDSEIEKRQKEIKRLCNSPSSSYKIKDLEREIGILNKEWRAP